MPRELGYILQSGLDANAAWYMDGIGRLDMTKLLTAFRAFFGEHAEHWLGRFSDYPEAGSQLILQAYLQRVVNGGGRIEREYGLGRGRTDLLVLWPREPGQPSDLWERFVVECKVLRDSDRKSLERTVEQGGAQRIFVATFSVTVPKRGNYRRLPRRSAFSVRAETCRRTRAGSRRLPPYRDRRRTGQGHGSALGRRP